MPKDKKKDKRKEKPPNVVVKTPPEQHDPPSEPGPSRHSRSQKKEHSKRRRSPVPVRRRRLISTDEEDEAPPPPKMRESSSTNPPPPPPRQPRPEFKQPASVPRQSEKRPAQSPKVPRDVPGPARPVVQPPVRQESSKPPVVQPPVVPQQRPVVRQESGPKEVAKEPAREESKKVPMTEEEKNELEKKLLKELEDDRIAGLSPEEVWIKRSKWNEDVCKAVCRTITANNRAGQIAKWDMKTEGEMLVVNISTKDGTQEMTKDGMKDVVIVHPPIYISPRNATCIYYLALNPKETNIPRPPVFDIFRSKIYWMPRVLHIERMVINNTPKCQLETTLLEFAHSKKFTCDVLEYVINVEWIQPTILFRLCRWLRPKELVLHLNFGTWMEPVNDRTPKGAANKPTHHVHLWRQFDIDEETFSMDKDYMTPFKPFWMPEELHGHPDDMAMLKVEMGKGFRFAGELNRTLKAIFEFVRTISTENNGQSSAVSFTGLTFMPLIPPNTGRPDTSELAKPRDPCEEFQKYITQYYDEMTSSLEAFSRGDRVFVCCRSDVRRQYKATSAIPIYCYNVPLENAEFMFITKSLQTFTCLFRTNVDQDGAELLLEEWYNGRRTFEEYMVLCCVPIAPNFIDSLHPDKSNAKLMKLRRVHNNIRTTCYIDRSLMANQILHVKCVDVIDGAPPTKKPSGAPPPGTTIIHHKK